MSSTTTTQYYGLTQYVGTDKPSFLDNNEAFAAVDAALHGAVTGVASQGETISGLSSTVGALGETVTGLSNSLDAEKAKIVTLQNKEITQDAAIAEVKADALDMICANNEEAATSTHAYSVGDFFRYNDVLYIATDAITIGATIVPNVNCEATNVTEELLAGVDKLGDLTSLTTTDKTSAVAAINEVNDALSALTPIIDDLSTFDDTSFSTSGVDDFTHFAHFTADKSGIAIVSMVTALTGSASGEFRIRFNALNNFTFEHNITTSSESYSDTLAFQVVEGQTYYVDISTENELTVTRSYPSDARFNGLQAVIV